MKADWGGLKAVEIGSLKLIMVGTTFVSYMLIMVGQKNLRPTVAGMYNYIQPLVACIVAEKKWRLTSKRNENKTFHYLWIR